MERRAAGVEWDGYPYATSTTLKAQLTAAATAAAAARSDVGVIRGEWQQPTLW